MPQLPSFFLYLLSLCINLPPKELPTGRYYSQDSDLSDYSLGDFWDIEEEEWRPRLESNQQPTD